jgi:predicted dienelactone hydrolase
LQRTAARTALVALSLILLQGCGDSSSGGAPAADPSARGPYPVGVTRIELFDDARGRTLLTEVWYPADESARDAAPSPAAEYLPEGLGFLADDATIELTAVREAPLAPGGPFPLIAFSHGSGGIRFQNTFQVEHLASHGYVVVAPDHEGNTFFDGSGEIEQLRVERPLDVEYVLNAFSGFTGDPASRFADWIDTDRPYGVTGHSFGAFTSFAVASMDARIGAALPMALAGPVSSSYSAATFLMLATQDKTIGLDANQAIRDAYDVLPGPRWLAEYVDAGHYSFSFACDTGLGIGDGDGCGTGTRLEDGSPVTFVDYKRVYRSVNTWSAALFGRYLRGIGAYDDALATNQDPDVVRFTADARNGVAAIAGATRGLHLGLVLP